MIDSFMQTEGFTTLVAGVGNELKCDDAFGVIAAERMKDDPRMTEDIVIQQVGIGGIHMVQEPVSYTHLTLPTICSV